MDTTTVTNHTVNVYQSDFIAWLAQNAGSLVLNKARVQTPIGGASADGRALEIVLPIDTAYLDTFLHGVIQALPAAGGYSYVLVSEPTGLIARVTWET